MHTFFGTVVGLGAGVVLGFVFNRKIAAAIASLEVKIETKLTSIEMAIKAKL